MKIPITDSHVVCFQFHTDNNSGVGSFARCCCRGTSYCHSSAVQKAKPVRFR